MSLGLPLKVRDVSLMHRLGLIDMLTRSGLVEVNDKVGKHDYENA